VWPLSYRISTIRLWSKSGGWGGRLISTRRGPLNLPRAALLNVLQPMLGYSWIASSRMAGLPTIILAGRPG
jgi:hypothetical protein